MTANIVTLNKVKFGYSEDIPLLCNVDLSVTQGKITAIMGGSGSGKTTLLRLISGQIIAQSGTVNVFNKNLAQLSSRQILGIRNQIGMLFQFGALFTDMTVFENVAFPLVENTMLPKSLIQKIVAMKLEAVGLTGTQNMLPNQLSGGMARRVALARAMALDPELMLYDEPFTGLDPVSLNIVAMLIKTLNSNLGQTSVLVTHDVAVTLKIADYIYFMANGKIIGHGTPEAIKTTSNLSIKQFIQGTAGDSFAYKYPASQSYAHYLGIE